MRKFDQDLSCFGTERRHNFFMYGRENRYIPFDLKYLPDVLLLCVKEMMRISIDKGAKYDIYAFAITAVSEGFFPFLDACLDYDKATCKTHEVSKYIIKRLKHDFDIIDNCMDELKNIKDKIDNEKLLDQIEGEEFDLELLHQFTEGNEEENLRKQNMFLRLDKCHHTFHIKDTVPVEMNPLIEKFTKMIYEVLDIDKEPVIIPNKNQPSGKEEELARKGLFCRDGVLILRDIHFYDLSDASILLDITEERIPYIPRAIVFDNCCLNIQNFGFGPLTDKSFYFQNCHFKQGVNWMGQKDLSYIVLDNCVISDSLNFTFNHLLGFYINDCIFEKESNLKIEWFGSRFVSGIVQINDCVFHGGFEVFKWPELNLKMKNITFYQPFAIKNTSFNKSTKISNLCFPTTTTSEMEASKKQLYDSLVESGLKEMAEELNLLSDKKKKTDFDSASYEIAYNTGWLNNTFAARCLGKSTNYLYKKRKADMKTVTQQSLPFRGTGKDIQYPVEALLAFKAKDWGKLKELRKKYPIPTE